MGRVLSKTLAWAIFSGYLGYGLAETVWVSEAPPANAAAPLPEAFVSFSLEFANFPEFAGNLSHPNTYSDTLLGNLAYFQGKKPYIRVGGNTQDYALYDPNLKVATKGTLDHSKSSDFLTTLSIGPSFFESYKTWPDTKFIHGFNLGLGGKTAAGWDTLLQTVPLACRALGRDRLLWWEYGNEPDLYTISAQGPKRPPQWSEADFVAEWLRGTRAIKEKLKEACPDLVSNETYGYLAPSFGATTTPLKLWPAWQKGLNADGNVKQISSHHYWGGARQAGVSLQGTLMNHASTVRALYPQIDTMKSLAFTGIPFILGETNSLYDEGARGLSDSFGAALWGIDFSLHCATTNISRIHLHQGLSYRYSAWQPVAHPSTTIGTKPPYYGLIFTAAMISPLIISPPALKSPKSKTHKPPPVHHGVQIVSLPLPTDFEAAYAAYVNEKLARIGVVNMKEYNYDFEDGRRNPVARPSKKYTFQIPSYYTNGRVGVQRLVANGSDAITGITFDGWSYNWELERGMPVRLPNVTWDEEIKIQGNVVSVDVRDSEAVIMNFGRW